MIYDNAIEEVKGAEEIIATDINAPVRLAEVTSLTSGKAAVKFYGDSEASTKLYPYIEGYKPSVNDKVAMLAQGNTYIILGKISTENITTNYHVLESELENILSAYLTTSSAAETYLSKSDASSTYETSSHASSTYETSSHASSTYETSSHASSTYLSKTDAASTYVKKTDGISEVKNGSHTLTMDSSGNFLPGSSSDVSIGSASKKLEHVYSEEVHVKYLRQGTENSGGLQFSANILRPVSTGSTSGINLGTSMYQYENIYGKNIYVNGSPISTSDRRLKKSIKTLGRKWLDFFYRLRPTSFKYKDGTSGRTHTGFIAQEVEEAAKDAGIERQDIATIVVDEDGRYYLRYEELIAVQTLAIHDLQDQIDDLRTRLTTLERALKK